MKKNEKKKIGNTESSLNLGLNNGTFPPRPLMYRLSPYQDLLRIGKSRKGAIFLDIGSGSKNQMSLPSPQKRLNP
jgi:hypothetical protein